MMRAPTVRGFQRTPSAGIFRRAAGFSPLRLPNLAAWYDLGPTRQVGTTSDDIRIDASNRVSLIADRSGNSGTNCLCLPGVASNFASAPDSVPLSITGSIDLRADVAFDSWTPATNQMVISKLVTSGQFSYDFFVTATSGVFTFRYSPDGTTVRTANSSVGSGLAAFSRRWVRATYNSSTGDVQFFTSTDGTNWVQLGTTVSLTAGSIFDGNTGVGIGANTGGSNFATGRFYRAQIRNGIDGTLAFDANFATFTKLASSGTESSANAATVTINSSGDLGARVAGERDLVQLTASKQPIYLPWSGTNYGWLRGNAADFFSTPSSAANQITGDIDIRVYATVANGASNPALLFKDNTTVSCYRFRYLSGGTLRFSYSTSGSPLIDVNSTATVVGGTSSPLWFRATRQSSTGSVKFYTSTDGATWTQLGTTVAGSAGTMHNDASIAIAVGGISGGGAIPLQGDVLRAQIINGYDGAGSVVADFDPSRYTSGTTFTASTGEVWTLNGGATVVTNTSLYFDGSDDYMKAAAFSLSQPETGYIVGSQVSFTSGDGLFDGGTGAAYAFQNITSPNVAINAGSTAGNNTGFVLQSRALLRFIFNGASSSTRINRNAAVTGNAGANNPNGFTIGSDRNGAGATAMTLNEAALYSESQDTATGDRFALYAASKWRISGV